MNEFSRTELLLGKAAVEKLKSSRIAIFGLGGVGGHSAEALVRAGIGSFDLIDNDTVSISNLNRQIFALHSTIGQFKTEVAKKRMLDINPTVDIKIHNVFVLPENADSFDFASYDYVIDAVDTVTAKLTIALHCKKFNIPFISSMGAGNKLDPTAFVVADIFETSICPLARVMRELCRKNGITSMKVVYSKEKPVFLFHVTDENIDLSNIVKDEQKKRSVPGSVSFVPSVAGLIAAGEAVKNILS